MDLDVTGEVWHWRGPSPYFFLTLPQEQSDHLRGLAAEVTYGWGMVPVRAQIGATTWTTSLFPKDGGYVLPLKAAVRRAEGLDEGATVTAHLTVDV